MKPMIKYRGGKTKELPEILPFVPKEYDRYVEPFFGGGALYFYLEPERALINDLNARLMDFYLSVRNDYDFLHEELDTLANIYKTNRLAYEKEKAEHPEKRVHDQNEDLYYSIRNMFNGKEPSAYSDAALYFFINKTAYSGMIRYNANGEYNVPYGRYKQLNAAQVSRRHMSLLQGAQITAGDYQEVFDACSADDFVFLDPPYDCIFSDYGNKETRGGFSEAEHHRLQEAFYNLPCKALLVIGKTELTENLYGDKIIYEYKKRYAVNIRNRFKASSSHILVANR